MKRSQQEGKKSSDEPKQKKVAPSSQQTAKKSQIQKEAIQTGKIGKFLSEKWPDELLIGNPSTLSTDDALISNLDRIARFLADYRAMSAVHTHQSQQPRNQQLDHDTPTNNTSLQGYSHSRAEYYIPTIESFANNQIERQSAGLRSNTSSQTTGGMAKVVDAHTQALEAAMLHVVPFQCTRFGGPNSARHRGGESRNQEGDAGYSIPSKQNLCQWHGTLYSYASSSRAQQPKRDSKNSDKKPSAVAKIPTPTSSFRTGGARAGNTRFCPPREIGDEFQSFRRGMIGICQQWEHFILPTPEPAAPSNRTTPPAVNASNAVDSGNFQLSPQQRSVFYSVGAAAMLLHGVLNIHMFSDGNGRLARIVTNWMLKRTLGIPFTIAIAANPQQRREYVEAVQKGHGAVNEALQNLEKEQVSNKSNKKRPPLPKIGIFEPLVRLLLDRLAHAVQECQRNLDEKSRASKAAEGDRLARIARERMASGACVICLDDNPNIATLCCGQGVHLNCVAEWLANNATCVHCRKPFQSLQVQRPPPPPRRPVAAAAVAPNAGANGSGWVLEEVGRNATAISSTAFMPAASQMRFQNQSLRNYLMGIHDTLRAIARGETGIQNQQQNAETTTEDTTIDDDNPDTTTYDTTTVDNDDPDTTTYDTTTVDNDNPDTTNYDTTTVDSDNPDTTTYDTTTVDNDNPDTTSYDTTTVDNDNPDTTIDDTTDDTSDTVTTFNVHQNSSRCAGCNNRAAVDCANSMCGRCCIINGNYQCSRHGRA